MIIEYLRMGKKKTGILEKSFHYIREDYDIYFDFNILLHVLQPVSNLFFFKLIQIICKALTFSSNLKPDYYQFMHNTESLIL